MAGRGPAEIFTELLRRDRSMAESAIQDLVASCSMINAAITITEGKNRVLRATPDAIRDLGWQDSSIPDGVLLEVQCNGKLTNDELEASVEIIRGALGAELDILVGSVLDEKIEDAVRVTVVATGRER
jgi:cell division protein FtsZ